MTSTVSDLCAGHDLVSVGARRHADRPAVVRTAAAGGAGFRYAELRERVECSAAHLVALGLVPGERVLLALPGCPEWAAAFFGILRAGLIAVPIPPGTSPEFAASVATSTRARAAVLAAGARAEPWRGLLALPVDDVLRAPPGERATRAPVAPVPGTALLAFTSGSTAHPRAVELTHANLLANLSALLRVRTAAPDDALLSMLPPAHLFELVAGLLAPLACGARVVYAGPPLPNRLVEALRSEGITHALTVPALLDALHGEVLAELAGASVSEQRRADAAESAARLERLSGAELGRVRTAVRARIGDSLRVLCVGGAAVDPAWARVLAPLGIRLEVGYGLSEAGPIVSLGLAGVCPADSVGRPLPGVDVRVDGRGEIHVRGPSVMRGYWDDPVGSAEALSGGWLCTGDLGRLDAQGFLFVSGRLKDVIVTASGETLYPEEIEPHYASPLFAEHCVVPVRGRQGNDVPTLVVVPTRREITDEELAAAVARLRASAPARGRVAGFLRRAEPLPRTALGKLRRRVLADALANDGGGPA